MLPETRIHRPRPPQATLVRASRESYARRAEIRRRLRHTNTDVRELLTTTVRTNPDLSRLPVRSVLLELPGMGPTLVDPLLNELGIAPAKPLRQLSPTHLRALADRLDPV